jgi:hypothetical protein
MNHANFHLDRRSVAEEGLRYLHLRRLWLYESGGKAPHSKRFA